jgi:RHS repeat-associated protein
MATPEPAGQSGSGITTYAYDGDGNVLTTTAPAAMNGGSNQVTVDTYNATGELTSQTTGYGTSAVSIVSYCYDPDGQVTSVVYGDGDTSGVARCSSSSPWTVTASPQANYQTTDAYDSAGELVSTTTPETATAPGGGMTTSTFDAAGNMLTSTDLDGVTAAWTYTPLNQFATVSYSGSSAHAVAYVYDADGNQTGMTDATGTSSNVYDSFGELTSAENGAGQATTYGYNADGQVTGITYPLPSTASWATSDTVSNGYDDADELTSVTDFNGRQITIGNTADGLPDSEALGSTGDIVTTTHDSADAVSAITLKNSSSTLQSFTYSDSPSGTIQSETDTPSSPESPVDYTYNARGQVTSEIPGTGSAQNYGYDASSNPTTLPTGGSGTYDKAGELTSSTLSGTTINYNYNADGAQLTSTQGSTTESSATWNGAGQLTAYSGGAANMTAATYDGDGMRASDTIGGSTNSFTWMTAGTQPKVIMDSDSAYIYTNFIAPTEQVNLATGTITYLVADALGSVRGAVSASGALTGTTSYDAWGNPTTSGGLAAVTPFGFAGNYADPTGLQYLLNRYYLPTEAQFLSVDSELSQTLQPYIYASGNPVSRIDPSGNSSADGCTLRNHYLHPRTSSGGKTIGFKPDVDCDDRTAEEIKIWAGIYKTGCDNWCWHTVYANSKSKYWTTSYIRLDINVTCKSSELTTYWGESQAWITWPECQPNGSNVTHLPVTETPEKELRCGT